jgi:hypothetical protein
VSWTTYIAAALLYFYGGRTIHFLLKESFKPTGPNSPTDAQLVALAVMHGVNGDPVAELQKLEEAFAAEDKAAEVADASHNPVAEATRAVLERRSSEHPRRVRRSSGVL